MKPTNVTRLLDQRKIAYTAHQLPPEKLGALEAARYLDVPAELVFKTIVVKRVSAGKPILALVPGTQEVNLKALAKVIGEKKVVLPTQREAEQITGLQACVSSSVTVSVLYLSHPWHGISWSVPCQSDIPLPGQFPRNSDLPVRAG